MEYICNTIEEANRALSDYKSGRGDIFICSDEVFEYLIKQPERSKREDLDKKFESFFPPPWNINEHPEKTKGWIEFQREMRKDPKYYLGCGALNTMET